MKSKTNNSLLLAFACPPPKITRRERLLSQPKPDQARIIAPWLLAPAPNNGVKSGIGKTASIRLRLALTHVSGGAAATRLSSALG